MTYESPSSQFGAIDLRSAIDRILERHRKARRVDRGKKGDHPTRRTRHQMLSVFHLNEARLWALAYPDDALEKAVSLTSAINGDPDDKLLGVYLLRALAEIPDTRALGALTRLAAQRDQWGELAMQGLIEHDKQGAYRHIYHEGARQGSRAAVEALGYWPDPISRQILEQVKAQSLKDVLGDSELPYIARRSMEQMEILGGDSWQTKVELVLTSREGAYVKWFPWALRIGLRNSTPGIVRALRKRLDDSEKDIQGFSAAYLDLPEGANPVTNEAYRESFIKEFWFLECDVFYDDVLIGYARVGGELTELQRARVRALGYQGDPKERLAELLTD